MARIEIVICVISTVVRVDGFIKIVLTESSDIVFSPQYFIIFLISFPMA